VSSKQLSSARLVSTHLCWRNLALLLRSHCEQATGKKYPLAVKLGTITPQVRCFKRNRAPSSLHTILYIFNFVQELMSLCSARVMLKVVSNARVPVLHLTYHATTSSCLRVCADCACVPAHARRATGRGRVQLRRRRGLHGEGPPAGAAPQQTVSVLTRSAGATRCACTAAPCLCSTSSKWWASQWLARQQLLLRRYHCVSYRKCGLLS
jgi:hypothetical protein